MRTDVLFKTPEIGNQWIALNAEVRLVIGALSEKLSLWGLPALTITDALRTVAEQEEIYWRDFASEVSEKEAREMARNKFSWHMCGCAVDFRGSTRPFSGDEDKKIGDYLHMRCPKPQWEVLMHDVGFGLHWHLAKRDWMARRKWNESQRMPA